MAKSGEKVVKNGEKVAKSGENWRTVEECGGK